MRDGVGRSRGRRHGGRGAAVPAGADGRPRRRPRRRVERRSACRGRPRPGARPGGRRRGPARRPAGPAARRPGGRAGPRDRARPRARPDADGTGTTMLTALPGTVLDPRFGAGSARRTRGPGTSGSPCRRPRPCAGTSTCRRISRRSRGSGSGPPPGRPSTGSARREPVHQSERVGGDAGRRREVRHQRRPGTDDPAGRLEHRTASESRSSTSHASRTPSGRRP